MCPQRGQETNQCRAPADTEKSHCFGKHLQSCGVFLTVDLSDRVISMSSSSED